MNEVEQYTSLKKLYKVINSKILTRGNCHAPWEFISKLYYEDAEYELFGYADNSLSGFHNYLKKVYYKHFYKSKNKFCSEDLPFDLVIQIVDSNKNIYQGKVHYNNLAELRDNFKQLVG